MIKKSFVFSLILCLSFGKPLFAEEPAFSIKRISTGVVTPFRAVTLSAKLMGRVEKITRQEGEHIKKGDILLSIVDAEYLAELKSAEAMTGLSRADLQYKTKQEARMQSLFRQKSVSVDKLEESTLAKSVAEENLRKAEAAVDKAKAIIRETKIIAPFNAIVISKTAEIGQMTSPGMPLFVLEDQSRLKFKTSVKESDVPHIRVGQEVRVTVDALDNVILKAQVHKIIPSGDTRTHTFTVELFLPPHKGLYVGMYGKADFSK